jgi:hypothetical protein
MKKLIAIALSTLSLIGCVSINEGFNHLSSIQAQYRGVSLNEGGDFAQVGMFNNTCFVETSNGFITTDLDLSIGEEDFVQDTLKGSTLVIGDSGSGIVVLDSDLGYYHYPTDSLGQIVNAKFTEEGYAVVSRNRGECSIGWLDTSANIRNTISTDCQIQDLDVDPVTGKVFIAVDNQIRIGWTEDPPLSLNLEGNLISFNPILSNLYVAKKNETIVTGVLSDDSRWSVDLGLPVTAIDNIQDTGELVVIAGDIYGGRIFILDGMTGFIETIYTTPGTADEINISDSGNILAISVEDTIHFFSISR